MSRFQAPIALALQTVNKIAGVEITYKRGANSVALKATPGSTEFKENNDFGAFRRVVESKDFIFDGAELYLGGVLVEPEDDDTIEQIVGDNVLTYRVLPFGDNPIFHRVGDTDGIRVHTKLDGSAAA